MPPGLNVRVTGAALYFLPVQTRIPLKFGPETLTSVTCARVRITVTGPNGTAQGWGETPLSAQWAWPGAAAYDTRHAAMMAFTQSLPAAWANFNAAGHPIEIGHAFLEGPLPQCLHVFNARRAEPMPWLAALICNSAFDIALHDAYGMLHHVPVYETYNAAYMNRDLSAYLDPAEGSAVSFDGAYPDRYLVAPPSVLPAWHLVGGADLLLESERDGSEPDDGYPVSLEAWIARDGLNCLKVKLRGSDADWDCERLARVGAIAERHNVAWLAADFNCQAESPEYVNGVLDRLISHEPRTYQRILYVEQPFPYELESHPIDVHSVAARKPLYMDESAHDWRLIRLGRSLGWSGVALKTCKTQTGAILSLSWAKAHGMAVMVQDLTNPMLAQIPHVLLAAHAATVMGVETNAMQFYPEASRPEALVHPGLYRRRNGRIDLSTVQGPGFGYRLSEMTRDLPECAAACE